MRPSASAPEVPATRQKQQQQQQTPPAIPYFQPRKRRVWRSGPRKPPPPTALGMLRGQLVASASAIDHPSRTPLEVKTELNWLKGLQARQARVEELGQQSRDRAEDEINLFKAQMDASFLMTCGAVFINPVDKITLLGLLSNLRKSHAPLEPSPLTEPEEIILSPPGSPMRSPGSRGGTPKVPRPSSSVDPHAEAMLSRTIKFAHERRRRQEASPRRSPSPTSRGGGCASTGGSATASPMRLTVVQEANGNRRTTEELLKAKRQRALQKRMCSRYPLQHLHNTHSQQIKSADEEAERIQALRERVRQARMTLADAPPPPSPNRLSSKSSKLDFFD